MDTIDLGTFCADVELKKIKNVHLSVYPPNGRVRISAPMRMDLETIRIFAISKLSWIKKQQAKFKNQERETPRDYLYMESHYLFGKRYLFKINTGGKRNCVTIEHDYIVLNVKPDTQALRYEIIMQEWYRKQLKTLIPSYIDKWENIIKVKTNEFSVKKMKTRWGTCNTRDKRIWLNLELAKKPKRCLEYVIVHELVHFLEQKHNERFAAYMDNFLPDWRIIRDELNSLPIGHFEWKY